VFGGVQKHRRFFMSPLLCPEKRKLLDDYALAVRGHAASIVEITRRLDTLDKIEYAKLFRTTEVCFEVALGTHECLERHVAEHGC
jgi:hypothetical protein